MLPSPLVINLAQEHQAELRRAAEAYRRRFPPDSEHADVPSRGMWRRSRQRLGALFVSIGSRLAALCRLGTTPAWCRLSVDARADRCR